MNPLQFPSQAAGGSSGAVLLGPFKGSSEPPTSSSRPDGSLRPGVALRGRGGAGRARERPSSAREWGGNQELPALAHAAPRAGRRPEEPPQSPEQVPPNAVGRISLTSPWPPAGGGRGVNTRPPGRPALRAVSGVKTKNQTRPPRQLKRAAGQEKSPRVEAPFPRRPR